MNERHELLDAELKGAENSNVTPMGLNVIRKVISFPEDIEGKVVIDICSGASDAALELSKIGAKACGVDFRYGNLKELKRKIDNSLNNYQSTVKEDESPELIRMIRKMRDKFFQFADSGTGDYIAAMASSLPFKDDSVDFCFSTHGISGIYSGDHRTTLGLIQEAIRVVKPGGEIQLYPWLIPDLKQHERAGRMWIIRNLSSMNVNCTEETALSPIDTRLVITKL